MYRSISHQADIAVEIEADSLEELFRDSLSALIELLTGDESEGARHGDELQPFVIEAEGFDSEELLVGLLGELLFAAQTRQWGPREVVSVELIPASRVTATINGIPNGGGEKLRREIKAATYHNLKISFQDKWRVRIVFDV